MTQGRAVVVTGGAGGLGAAAVKRFAAAGYAVHVFDMQHASTKRDESNVDDLIVFHEVDVRNDEGVQAAFNAVEQTGVDLHGIIHCAGIAGFGPNNPGHLVDPGGHAPIDNFRTIQNVINTNLSGTFSVVRHGASLMARNSRNQDEENGFIIMTSSGAAIDGKAGQSAYSASKAAIIGMTLPLARELSSLSIRVVTIAPGLFDTPILADTPKLERHVPYPSRVGDPDEFARLALHISENQYINAEVIRIDGGNRGGFHSASPFIR